MGYKPPSPWELYDAPNFDAELVGSTICWDDVSAAIAKFGIALEGLAAGNGRLSATLDAAPAVQAQPEPLPTRAVLLDV